MKSKQKYCKCCDGYVLAHKADGGMGCGGHLVCLALTILTGAIFLPFWGILSFYDNEKFRCSVCGGVCK